MSINRKKLEDRIKLDSTFVQRLQSDPSSALEEVTNPIKDRRVFTTVLIFVGAALLISLLSVLAISLAPGLKITKEGGTEMVLVRREVSQMFLMIGSAAIGALAGLLVPTPEKGEG